jgi:tRNA-specific 2-thiouridylase
MNVEVDANFAHRVKGKRVFVGLSGGVDSAVSAALLVEAGAEVFGVFIQGWYPPGQPCTWREDRRDAMRVAAHLGIPFRTLDASVAYKKGVIDYLVSEYAAGRTPNPDVMCNRDVKFGAFYTYAKEHGADLLATGHYAYTDSTNPSVLLRGKDLSKDQSYFLWAVPSTVIAETVFPVGNMPKKQVRAIATQLHVPVATKKDSQGVCFLGSISIDDFLRQEISVVSGDAFYVDKNGLSELVGKHEGAILYTLGEKVSLMAHSTNRTSNAAAPGPWFVTAKELANNTLTVSTSPVAESIKNVIELRDENWISDPESYPLLTAQYRYHGEEIIGTYSRVSHTFTPQVPGALLLAPGQSLVLYAGNQCVGGGIIV